MRRPVMREMSSWSAIVSSTTESSVSFREVSIASSFCACGTVRGNPSSTKLQTKTKTKKKLMRQRRCQQVKENLAPAQYVPVLALLVVLELVPDYTHHDIVRNEPASIHDLLRLHTERRLLRHLLAQQVARREVTHTELIAYSRRLRALACASRRVASSAREAKKKKKRGKRAPAPGGPTRIVRSCCAGVGFFDTAFASSSVILSVSWPTRDLRYASSSEGDIFRREWV